MAFEYRFNVIRFYSKLNRFVLSPRKKPNHFVLKIRPGGFADYTSVQALTLSKSEVEKHCADLTNTVKELDLKVKRLQAASTNATKTEVEVQTIVKDSIIYRDTSYLKVQAIRWKDPWINVDGLIMPDKKLDLRIQSVDTLFQVVHRVPKQWLFFRWGTKAIRQEVVSSNPHTKIVYSEYIELKKRKKK